MTTTETIIETKYQIVSPNETADDDSDLIIAVSITRKNGALAGTSEDQVVAFVRGYLATLTTDPVNITKIQTVATTGL